MATPSGRVGHALAGPGRGAYARCSGDLRSPSLRHETVRRSESAATVACPALSEGRGCPPPADG